MAFNVAEASVCSDVGATVCQLVSIDSPFVMLGLFRSASGVEEALVSPCSCGQSSPHSQFQLSSFPPIHRRLMDFCFGRLSRIRYSYSVRLSELIGPLCLSPAHSR